MRISLPCSYSLYKPLAINPGIESRKCKTCFCVRVQRKLSNVKKIIKAYEIDVASVPT